MSKSLISFIKDNNPTMAEMYEGILDGTEFCDFYKDRDFLIEYVAFWTEIDNPI